MMRNYQSANFQYQTLIHHQHADLIMNFPKACWSTTCFPEMYHFLQVRQPSVLETTCFNDENLTFSEEVKQTEMGHLFEHLVIDQLCQLKAKTDDAEFEGCTEWNWWKYPIGSFKVTININHQDQKYLDHALRTSEQLIEDLYAHLPPKSSPKGAFVSS